MYTFDVYTLYALLVYYEYDDGCFMFVGVHFNQSNT